MKIFNKWTTLIIISIILAFAYIYVEQSKLSFKKEIFITNQSNRKQCLADAKAVYTEKWNKSCRAKKRGNKCALETDLAEYYQKEYKDSRNDCIKMYTTN